MSPKRTAVADPFDDFAAFVGPGAVARLRGLGHDFLETRRAGPCVWDAAGKRYFDCFAGAGTFNLGRRPPRIVAALQRALTLTDQGNFAMISIEKARLAATLADFTPGGLDCAVFSVVRGETVEFACKLARGFTGRPELIAFAGGWHGETGFALSLSTRPDQPHFAPLTPRTRLIPFGDIDAARQAITGQTAAVFFEPVQAENHGRAFAGDFLRDLERHCRAVGALLVADETQTGFGRTGKRFAVERAGVDPDMLIVGEALGAGIFPIAATIYQQRLNAFMNDHPLIHLSTFGGSDLGCLVALEALAVYEETRPWENAEKLGVRLREGLEKIAAARPRVIESVAGVGLLLSLQLATPAKARDFCKALAKEGVLAMPGAVEKRAVVLRPCLTITAADADEIVAAVGRAAKGK
jgi:acetylornithine/succinyldiaminopimelate/putrescine aminotransferase